MSKPKRVERETWDDPRGLSRGSHRGPAHPSARLALVGGDQAGVGTDACEVHHLGVLLSGSMHIVHSDGTEAEVGPGGVYNIQPGHDAWVVGDQEVVGVELDTKTAATFAKG